VPGIGFLIQWLVLNTFSADLAIFGSVTIINNLNPIEAQGNFGFLGWFIVPAMLFSGLSQWVALSNYLKRPILWFFTSLLGAVVGALLSWAVQRSIYPLHTIDEAGFLYAIICQFIIGIIHGILLTFEILRKGWFWYPIATLSGLGGTLFLWRWLEGNYLTEFSGLADRAFAGFIVGVPFSAVTGIAVLWLLQPQYESNKLERLVGLDDLDLEELPEEFY
jgi:hypothetical protein